MHQSTDRQVRADRVEVVRDFQNFVGPGSVEHFWPCWDKFLEFIFPQKIRQCRKRAKMPSYYAKFKSDYRMDHLVLKSVKSVFGSQKSHLKKLPEFSNSSFRVTIDQWKFETIEERYKLYKRHSKEYVPKRILRFWKE